MALNTAFYVSGEKGPPFRDNIFDISNIGVITNTFEYSHSAPSSNSFLAVRPSDGHIFSFGNNGIIEEFTENLIFVQTFGNAGIGLGSLLPAIATDASWQQTMIQFIGSFVYLGWVGFSTQAPHVEVQKRDKTTFALIQAVTDFNTTLPPGGKSFAEAMSPDGNIFYINHTLSGVVDQNIVRKYNITTSTISNFVSYGTWSGTQGWIARKTGTATNGRVVVLYTFVNSLGNESDARIVAYSSSGTELSNFQVKVQIVTPSNYHPTLFFCIDPNETGVWTAGTQDTGPNFYDLFLHYNLTTGALIETFTPPIEAAPGTPMTSPIVLPAPTIPGGLYFINPNDKLHDSYNGGIEKKIPSPTIKTALIGS